MESFLQGSYRQNRGCVAPENDAIHITIIFHLHHSLLWNQIELREAENASMRNREIIKELENLASLLSLPRKLMVDGNQAKEQRPFTLNIVKDTKFPRLVVESAGILSERLVTVPQETFETVAALKFGPQCGSSYLNSLLRVYSKGRKSNDRKQPCISLFAVALPWQH